MQYKIIVDKQSRTNPSSEKKEYIIDIEELRVLGDVYDSLIITPQEDYVMRRLKLSEYHVLSVLEEPIKQPITDVKIELFEGENYIYLVDMTGNKFYAEYLIKNDFNNTFATRAEMNSAINQTAQSIELSVNQKFEGYSTTVEMNAAINVKADEINSTVNSKFTNYSTTTEMNSAINQKAGEISQEVEKKVDEETITGAYLILKINGDTSEAKLNADKIELTANDILNLIAGNALNLTSKNMTIVSTNFNVDKNGNVTCSSANITGGKITLDGDDTNPKFIVSNNKQQEALITPTKFWLKNAGRTAAWLSIDGNGKGSLQMPYDGYASFYGSGAGTEINSTGITTPKLTQTSLKSKKKNIKKLNVKAIDLIKDSDICLYNLKGEKAKSKKHIGLVIGDGYNCPDEVISQDGQGVEQYSMTSLAWKAIQELIEENNNLKQRIEKLEVR